ncbi:MAG: hypothetical protein ACK2U0_04985 [Candidatus Promineifilaceae bacterium]|jgi:hypothetical protein
MNDERMLQPVEDPRDNLSKLQSELETARASLTEAEAELAEEQAAVNVFRMHCRIRLDDLVDRYLQLRSERESLLINLEFLRQGFDPMSVDDDPLADEVWFEESIDEEDILLPTDTPTDKAAEKRLYRELARRFHPDLATNLFERAYRTTIMAAINIAYAERDTEALYDLAGELNPAEAVDLVQPSNAEMRRIGQLINKMRRLERKAKRQLAALRRENTARLWQRVQILGDQDEDGWTIIRKELQRAITLRENEIQELRIQLELLEQTNQEDRSP